MFSVALHVQHKDQDVFDTQNRVIPRNVVSVSTDTNDVRFGDGATKWRDLPPFGGGGEKSETPSEGYSGPLHTTVYDDDEIDDQAESSEVMGRVPDSNEMVVLGSLGVVFGNGVDSLGRLRRLGTVQ